jgi:DNA-binding transcriptional ArsR family regulator
VSTGSDDNGGWAKQVRLCTPRRVVPRSAELLRLLSLRAGRPEVCACALVEPLGKSQQTVSHHLKVLTEAGLITGEKRGRWIWYRVVPERLDSLRHALDQPAEVLA